MAYFLLGALFGLLIGLWQMRHARREAEQNAEDKQLIAQEKQLVVDFMHGMVEALGENFSREALLQRIVHAAVLNTGALSACLYERMERDTLRGVAVEGLFPPQRTIDAEIRAKASTRVRFLELIRARRSFPLPRGDRLRGPHRAARSGG
jgi:sigma-B regulation protein RsbU (phosphoserine phosphatase)